MRTRCRSASRSRGSSASTTRRSTSTSTASGCRSQSRSSRGERRRRIRDRHGHMDGFSVNAGKTPYMRYREDQIPSYWKYAKEFVLADHFFSESLAPSSPGHEVFWFGRSTTIDNPKCHLANQADCGHGCTGTHLTATTFNPRTGVERTVKPCFDLPSLP